MTTKVQLVTPNKDSAMDEANDAVRVSLVAGSISVSGSDGAILDGVTPSIKATVIDLTNSNPVATAIVDGSGNQITSFGGGTQYVQGTGVNPATGTVALGQNVATNALIPLPIDNTTGMLLVNLGIYNKFHVTDAADQNIFPNISTPSDFEFPSSVSRIGVYNMVWDSNFNDWKRQYATVDPAILNTSSESSPVTTRIGSFNYGWDGSVWLPFHMEADFTTRDPVIEYLGVNTELPKPTSVGTTISSPEITPHIKTLLYASSGGGSWDALKVNPGTGDLYVNSNSGGGALNIQDGGNSITVDGSVSATVSGSVSVSNFPAVQPVSDNAGSLTVDGSVTVTQATGTNLHTVVDSGTISTISNVVHVDDNSGSITVDGTFWQATQPVSGPLTDAQLRATPVPISGTVTASSSATATALEPTYTEASASAFSQDLSGRLRTKVHAMVSDAPETYVDNDVKPLSMTSEGRLRVSMVPAHVTMEMFHGGNFMTDLMDMTDQSSPWTVSSSLIFGA